MKQFIILLTSAVLIFFCTGCLGIFTEPANPSQNIPPQTNTPTTNDQSASIQPTATPQVYPYSLSAVSLPIHNYTLFSSDGTPIFQYIYQTMSFVSRDSEISDAIIVDYLNRIDFNGSAAESVYQAAQNAYTGQSDWQKFFFSQQFHVERIDQSITSIFGTNIYYDGAPQSGLVAASLTYDMLHGRYLSLKQLLVSNYDSAALCDLIVNGFTAEQISTFYPDYIDVIYDQFSSNIPVENWYLSGDGLCFYFNPGEIAPYSEDIPVSTIPYQSLTGLMQESYFPPETTDYSGTPKFNKLATDETPQFGQIIELVMAEDAPCYSLCANGTILHVRLYSGYWDDQQFIPEATLFAAQAITDTTALLLTCVDESLDNIYITYESAGQLYQFPLSELLS